MQEAGLNAVPIAALMAFLIGVVLAYMGAVQLRQFGAEIFVVDLIAIAVLRELGILLTAIIVAGRSASAFTAAIGSMKMREEIDAMRTLGLDPVEVLVVPRVLALLLTLPLLGFVAELGRAARRRVMAWLELGVSPRDVLRPALRPDRRLALLVGIIKAPFFALVIALIGCHHGLKVERQRREPRPADLGLGRAGDLPRHRARRDLRHLLRHGGRLMARRPRGAARREAVIEVRGLVNRFGAQVVARRASTSTSTAARCSASSAAPAPASRCCCARSSG